MTTWWDDIDRIVQLVRSASASERQDLIVEQCGDDEAKRRAVELIVQSDPPPDFLEPDVGAVRAGKRLGGYVLMRSLGSGGMGEVFLGRRDFSGAPVDPDEMFAAVKVLSGATPESRRRFKREAETNIPRHPGIVPVLDHGETGGIDWLVMPYVEGHSLRQEIDAQQAHVEGKPPTRRLFLPRHGTTGYVEMVVECVASVADALDHCHRNKVIHRDIKPDNLMIEPAGSARVTDFGIAKHEQLTALTLGESSLGSFAYMSPEQALQIKTRIGRESDVYSLGVVLFELLTLELPVVARTPKELVERIATGTLRRMRKVDPTIPNDLTVITERCLAWRPKDRYRTAGELAVDLRRVLRREAISMRPLSTGQRLQSWMRRHPSAAAMLATMVVGAAFAAWLLHTRSVAQRVDAWEARLTPALESVDWEVDMQLVTDARLAVEEIEAFGEVFASLTTTVVELKQRLSADASRRVAEVEDLLQRGRDRVLAQPAGVVAPTSWRDVLDAVQLASRGASLHWDDERLAELAQIEAIFPIVEVVLADDIEQLSSDEPVRAFARSIDELDGSLGELIELGELPVRAQLAPGDWRIIVEQQGFGFREYDRELVLSEKPFVIRARIEPTDVVRDGCVLLPSVELPLEDVAGCCLTASRVRVPSVWMSKTEVSNGEYLEFLRATFASIDDAPIMWREVGYDGDEMTLPGVEDRERFLSLPATGMGYEDMQAYAEWAGMRLPTHLELEHALRGASMQSTPYDGANLDAAWTSSTDMSDFGRQVDRFRRYVKNAKPVDDEDFEQGPYGLFHINGNAQEMTSGKPHEVVNGRLLVMTSQRIALGGNYKFPQDNLEGHGLYGVAEGYGSPNLGFRLVVSDSFRE